MFLNYPDLLTIQQVAEILKVSKNTIYKLLHTNQISHLRCAGKFRILKEGIIEYINKNSLD